MANNNEKVYKGIIDQYGTVDNYYTSSQFTNLDANKQGQIKNILGGMKTPIQTQAPVAPVAPVAQPNTQAPVQATLPQQKIIAPVQPVATQAPVDNSIVFGQQASAKQALDTTYLDKRNDTIAQQTIDQLNSIASQGQKVDATTRDSIMEGLIAKAGGKVQWDNPDRQNTIDKIYTKALQQTGAKDWNTAFSTLNKPHSQITQYTNGESLAKALDSGLVSSSQLQNIKQYNPQVYNEYVAKRDADANLALVNLSKPTASTLVADKGIDVSQLFQSLGLDMTKSADIDLVAKRQELYNTGEVKTAQEAYLKDKKSLEALKDTYMNIEDDVRAEYEGTGVTESFIMAKVANRQKPLYKQLQTQQRNYSNSLEAMQLAMGNAKDELDIYTQQAQLDRQETMDKLQVGQFAYGIMADQQAREDKYKLADIQFQQEKDMLAYKYDMEYGDINSSVPRIKERAIANNVDLLMKQYDGLIMSSRDQLVERIKTGMSAGKTYGTMLGEIMEDIRSKPNYKEYMNNKAGIDTQPRSLGGDMYTVYENGKWTVKTGEDLNPSPTVIQQMKEAALKERQLNGESQYDNQEFVNKILNGELKTRAGVACLPGQTGGQCGAFVNDLLGTSFGNTIESKINYAKTAAQYSPIPVVGGAVVIDNGSTYTDANGNKVNAGHVAIITAVNANGTINYIDSNGIAGKDTIGINKNRAVTDKMYFTRAKDRPAPTVSGSTAGATSTTLTTTNGVYDADKAALYTKYNSGKFASTDWKELANQGIDKNDFMAQATAYKNTITIANNKDSLDAIDKLAETYPGRAKAIASQYKATQLVNGDLADFYSQYKFIRDKLTMQALVTLKGAGATFGALSDKEREAIEASVSRFNIYNTEDEFKNNLQRAKKMLIGNTTTPGATTPIIQANNVFSDAFTTSSPILDIYGVNSYISGLYK